MQRMRWAFGAACSTLQAVCSRLATLRAWRRVSVGWGEWGRGGGGAGRIKEFGAGLMQQLVCRDTQ